ncbi:MAG: hypothetical protein R3Y28_08950 [Candidatus Gastranaerophilales bacterium]
MEKVLNSTPEGVTVISEEEASTVDILSRAAEKYPHKKFANEQELFEFLMQKNEAYERENEEMQHLAEENPEIAMLFGELSRTKDGKRRSIVSILTEAGVDLTPPSEGDEGYEDYESVISKRLQKKKDAEKRKKELEANYQESVMVIDNFLKAKNLKEEEEKAFIDFYEDIVDSSNRNLYTQHNLNKMFQAFKYEEDVESARQAGEVDGKNAKIENRRKKALQNTDGLASSGGSVTTESTKKQGYIEGLLKGSY